VTSTDLDGQQRTNVPPGQSRSTWSPIEATFDRLFAANVRAPYFLVGALAPKMAARGGGSIERSVYMAPIGRQHMAVGPYTVPATQPQEAQP